MTPAMWDIIGRRRWGYAFSLLLIIPGLIALVVNIASGQGALNWGVDFTGGNYFHLNLERPYTIGQVRAVVDRFATGQSIIQKAEQEVFIRTRPLGAQAKADLLAALRQQFGQVTVLREDEVGPKIGRELRNVAILGVVVGLALQVLYISFRFKSVRYALTADAALLHDLLIVVGVFALTRKEVNSSFVAVLLTVVGYSINDTIVVFDRIRENLALRTREAFDRMVNRSLLEALVRSINTVLTTVLALAAVYFFGGSTIRDFAFGLIVGIAVGAYSSVFNASALLVDWHLWAQRRAGGTRAPQPEERAPSVAPTGDPALASPASGARRRRSRRR
ncbi:MAG: protein translocase subunit SecF [Armatimonadota bacterium]|nr:protein translocase subunit SecF [Armatimonadota bacterium]MDR7549827.1 protein translocase subunit SecF [Armatimonadota bacterium]